MTWKPPEADDIETLKWLGVVGLFAAMVDILRQFIDAKSRLSWWQKLAHSALIGLLSIGMGALLIAVWPDIHFLMILGIASIGGYLGTDFIMWVAFKFLGDRRGK